MKCLGPTRPSGMCCKSRFFLLPFCIFGILCFVLFSFALVSLEDLDLLINFKVNMVCLSRFLQVWVVLAASVSHAVAVPAPRQTNDLEVVTTSGIVHGFINETVPGVRAFLGVPFARPPVGELRFLPPVPLNDSSRVVNATQFSASCSQFEGSGASAYNRDVREFVIWGPTGEDCLTLSIWAPVTATNESLPVFIWIYGGGYVTGGSNVPYQNPSKWVQRTQSHVVVSIQYRLNIFGFPQAAGLPSQNPGYLDQRLAMEWVRTNIAGFGGDPSRMVLWGQSAGASSVDVQNYAFPDDPIVSGFICDSGSVFLSAATPDPTYSNFTSVARHFNCSTESPAVELACMQTVPADAIESYLKSYSDTGASPGLTFSPVIDEVLLFGNYTQRALEGHLSDRPAIFGSNADEGTSLTTYPADPDTQSPDPAAVEQVTLGLFKCPAAESTTLREQAGRKTYRYEYRGNFTNIAPRFWLGAYHSSELPLIFGTDGDARGASTPFEEELSETMQDLWLAFARDPNHGLKALGWADTTTGQVAVFGGDANGTGLGSNQGGVRLQNVTLAAVDAACT